MNQMVPVQKAEVTDISKSHYEMAVTLDAG